MASEPRNICQLCRKVIKEAKHRIYFYAEKESHQRFVCHADCFKCLICKRSLSSQNYFLSPKKNFYCFQHYDFEAPNKHENIVRELKNFREKSREKISILRGGKRSLTHNLRSARSHHTESVKCDCICGNLLMYSRGYWIECTQDNCLLFNHYNQCCDSRNYDVPEWNMLDESEASFRIEHYEEEIYETCFINQKHYNYYSVDELIGPIVLSLKQEMVNKKEYYRILLRSSSYIVEGLLPVSCFCSNKYNEQQVLDILGKELQISSPLRQFADVTPPCKLQLLDKVMLKEEFKVGVVFIDSGQLREEDFFTNTSHSSEFEEFLSILGDRVKLKGFRGYSGGLDTSHSLTGECSIYKEWQKYKVMFHVSTLLPMEEHDDQKLQRKRHIGNDIVCLVFLAAGARFEPSSIKSNFLHVFIIIQPQVINSIHCYKVAVSSRDLVHQFGPPVFPSQLFKKDSVFQSWLYTKIINGERASYRSPKFAAMQERTRRQLLEEIVHDQACKDSPIPRTLKSPFQRFLPLRSSTSRIPSPTVSSRVKSSGQFPDWIEERFDNSDQLQRDFKRAFTNGINQYHDVFFTVGTKEQQVVPAVKAILAARSRVFHELLFPNDYPHSPLQRRSSMLTRTPTAHLVLMRTRKRWSELWGKKRSSSNANSLPKSSVVNMRNTNSRSSEFIVTEFEATEFIALLEFIHTGSCIVHTEILAGLSCAAEYYDIAELVKICLDCCTDIANPFNACLLISSLRKHTLRYSVAGLMQKMVLEYIEENAEKVFAFFDISCLSEDCFIFIISSKLKMSELRKFKAIRSWYNRTASLRQLGEDEGLKKSLLSYVDISAMTEDEQEEVTQFMSTTCAKGR